MAPQSLLALEREQERVEEMDRSTAEWHATAEAREFSDRFPGKLLESGGTDEFWGLVE